VGGQTIAIDANAISVNRTILKPGDPGFPPTSDLRAYLSEPPTSNRTKIKISTTPVDGINIDGTPIFLGSTVFVVGSRLENLALPKATMTAQVSYIKIGDEALSI